MELIAAVFIGLTIGWLSTKDNKTHLIRLIDVFVYGPILLYTAWLISYQSFGEDTFLKILAIILAFMGATTITFNLKNYLKG